MLNLKNGSCNMSYLTSVNNQNLLCIEVDDPVYSLNNWNNIDHGLHLVVIVN